MRLFLLPISARRTLIYCDKSAVARSGLTKQAEGQEQPKTAPSIIDRVTTKAAATWSEWEGTKGGWKKNLTTYGNALLRRIPYEEWGLKSFPPLTSNLKEAYQSGKRSVPISVIFPGAFLPKLKVGHVLSKLATERQDLHRKRMIGSAIGAPLTLPFALIPIIPNIPGFYLLFRAYSHYRALYGAKHLEYLVANNLISLTPSRILDQVYAAGLMSSMESGKITDPQNLTGEDVSDIASDFMSRFPDDTSQSDHASDVMFLNKTSGSTISSAFEVKEMTVEIERAVEQVEMSLKTNHER